MACARGWAASAGNAVSTSQWAFDFVIQPSVGLVMEYDRGRTARDTMIFSISRLRPISPANNPQPCAQVGDTS